MQVDISIVVPVFNSENYLEETIRSVFAQTYQNWELIIIDDGSIDESAEIALKFTQMDSRVCYFFQVNGGQAAARNNGIKKSRGTWIAFLDSDDLWEPEKLEIQITAAHENKADLIFSNGYIFESSQKPKIIFHKSKNFKYFTGHEMFKTLYIGSHIINSSVLVRTDVVKNVGYLDESTILRGTEDWDLWLRIAKNDHIFFGIKIPLVSYREHEQGAHLNQIRMLGGKLAVYQKYNHDDTISSIVRLRQYRYIYRQLLSVLFDEGNLSRIKLEFANYLKTDPSGLVSRIQSFLISHIAISSFIWLSNKIIYRIGYRVENLIYFFLKMKK